MLLIDIGQTVLGGPTRSPAGFITELLSLPQSAKPLISDLVFSQNHSTAADLIDDLSGALNCGFSDRQRAELTGYWNAQLDECLPLPGAGEFCQAIIDGKYPYALASNLWKPFHMALTRFIPELEANARFLFLSYVIGARKPSDDFYNHVFGTILDGTILERPGNVVMIGDSFENDILPCLARGAVCVMLDLANKSPDHGLIMKRAAAFPDGRLHLAGTYDECLALLETIIDQPTEPIQN